MVGSVVAATSVIGVGRVSLILSGADVLATSGWEGGVVGITEARGRGEMV